MREQREPAAFGHAGMDRRHVVAVRGDDDHAEAGLAERLEARASPDRREKRLAGVAQPAASAR